MSPSLAVAGLGLAILFNLIYSDRVHSTFVWPAVFVSIALGIASLRSGPAVVGRRFLSLLLPFAIPLLIMHGVLNRQFAVTSYLFDLVPIRFNGAEFAVSTLSRLSPMIAASMMFFDVDRGRFVDWLISLRFPVWLYVPAVQAVAISNLLARRVQRVLLAQQARGIAVGPGLYLRVRALPRIIIPVVTSLILEIDPRTYSLVARGFGRGPMASPSQPPLTGWEMCGIGLLALPLAMELCRWISF